MTPKTVRHLLTLLTQDEQAAFARAAALLDRPPTPDRPIGCCGALERAYREAGQALCMETMLKVLSKLYEPRCHQSPFWFGPRGHTAIRMSALQAISEGDVGAILAHRTAAGLITRAHQVLGTYL